MSKLLEFLSSPNPRASAALGLTPPASVQLLSTTDSESADSLMAWDRKGDWMIVGGGLKDAALSHPWAPVTESAVPMPPGLAALITPSVATTAVESTPLEIASAAPLSVPDPREGDTPAKWLEPLLSADARLSIATWSVAGPHREQWALLATALGFTVAEAEPAEVSATPEPAAVAAGGVM